MWSYDKRETKIIGKGKGEWQTENKGGGKFQYLVRASKRKRTKRGR